MTWPLAKVLPREIAGDLGDPLFNAYVLLWTSGQVLRVLHGDLTALSQYWHGNIFYPAPFAIAHSENLVPQMLQALPVFAATGNIVLAYNLLLLATFVLSGLGMYLLVRDVTDRPLAAFVAGVAFAFPPFRIDQWSHFDVLSSQWMPFALYGFRRFAVTGRLRALAGATAAVIVQGLSCLYYLAFFTPFAAAYALYELAVRGRLRDRRTVVALFGAAAAAILVIAVFLWPYVAVRRGAEHQQRPIDAVQQWAADTHAFATISERSRLLGSVVRELPRNEGQGFPGFTILMLALAGTGAAVAQSVRAARGAGEPRWRRAAGWVIAAILLVDLGLFVHLLATGYGTVTLSGLTVRMRYRPVRIIAEALALCAGLLLISPRARRAAAAFVRTPAAFFAFAAILAALLSLGPTVHAGGNELGPGLYRLVYQIPGFDAFRVVSLYFMLVALFVAALAGLGVAAFSEGRSGRVVAACAVIGIAAESWMVPVETHPPPQIAVRGLFAEPEGVYRFMRDLPGGPVVLELPFGDVWREAGYTFAAGYHRKPTVNGYSGFFPPAYDILSRRLRLGGAEAWSTLQGSGATHVIVRDDKDASWLRENGATEVAVFPRERVFVLP